MGDFGKGPPLQKNESGSGYHVLGAPGFESEAETQAELARRDLSGRSIRVVGVVHDNAIVDVDGVPTKRQYESRYDENGNFVSQGYTHHGPASPNETSAKTWRHR